MAVGTSFSCCGHCGYVAIIEVKIRVTVWTLLWNKKVAFGGGATVQKVKQKNRLLKQTVQKVKHITFTP